MLLYLYIYIEREMWCIDADVRPAYAYLCVRSMDGTDRCMDGWMEWIDAWMDGWMDWWMDLPGRRGVHPLGSPACNYRAPRSVARQRSCILASGEKSREKNIAARAAIELHWLIPTDGRVGLGSIDSISTCFRILASVLLRSSGSQTHVGPSLLRKHFVFDRFDSVSVSIRTPLFGWWKPSPGRALLHPEACGQKEQIGAKETSCKDLSIEGWDFSVEAASDLFHRQSPNHWSQEFIRTTSAFKNHGSHAAACSSRWAPGTISALAALGCPRVKCITPGKTTYDIHTWSRAHPVFYISVQSISELRIWTSEGLTQTFSWF